MSYAEIASKGPHQSAEDARAPPVPELEHTDDSTHSLIDVDSPHISSVPSDFESQSVKTDTQADRQEREAEDEAKRKGAEAKKKAEAAKQTAKEKSGRAGQRIKENADNPVVVGNALVVGVLGTALGVSIYKKYSAGELSWKIVGAWAGVVGLFAGADYYVTKYLFQKYPPKK